MVMPGPRKRTRIMIMITLIIRTGIITTFTLTRMRIITTTLSMCVTMTIITRATNTSMLTRIGTAH